MKKGISFYFGYDIKPKLRAKMIADTGFDCVITCADKKFDKQNGTIKSQVKLFKKYGLKLSSLHMAYDSDKLHYFWEKGEEGNKLQKKLIKDVKIAYKYGFSCVVVHLFGKYSKVGEYRLRNVLQVCEKLNVPLAIENTNSLPVFKKCFEKINNPYLNFCYDSGHNNVFDKEYDYLEKHQDKLITLHLHDNDGKKDFHTLEQFGTIDWTKIAKILAGKNLILDYEVLNRAKNNMSAIEFLQATKSMADRLEKLIEKEELRKNK